MSVANFKKFGQLCAEDENVRNKAKEIGIYNVDGLIKYGQELGLDFTADDMQTLADEAGISVDELNAEQLEQIAGGVVTTTVGGIAAAVSAVVAVGTAVRRW